MKKILGPLLAVVLLAPPAAAEGATKVELSSRHQRNVVGKVVEITLRNRGTAAVQLGPSWTIDDLRSGAQVSQYIFSADERDLQPGEEIVWSWMQDTSCYGTCPPAGQGEAAGPGYFEVSAGTSAGERAHRFAVGRYFTLGFRCGDVDCGWDDFVVYVNTPDEVAQMEDEAASSEKTLIVSGIVRRKKPYNPNWRFTMGPASIVLGEVFIEVCDGSPRYVQRHRAEWFGERWCPWSSYVEKVGR